MKALIRNLFAATAIVAGVSNFAAAQTSPLIVDVADKASKTEIAQLQKQVGGRWRPNSVVSSSNHVYQVFLSAAERAKALVALKASTKIDAYDTEHTFQLDPDFLPLGVQNRNVAGKQTTFVGTSASPNDPRYGEQWNFQMVGAEAAWKRSRGTGVVVAVIDTGVSGTASGKGQACRDFGTTAFTAGYDFVNNDADPYDDHGHGTHVAGTIAEATNNAEGVAGLAYGATIMPLKVLSAAGSGTSADIADAIRWAADKGAHVINMSLGSPFPDAVIRNACTYASKKGVVIVAAAGNSGKQGVGYPAAYSECIAVSSVGPSGKLAGYSSWGKQVALAAPGGDIGGYADRDESAGILQNTNLPVEFGGQGDGYYAFQGTSMASPHVAAAAALVMAQGIKEPAKVRKALTESAVKVTGGDVKKYGAGILNVDKATALAAKWTGRSDELPEPFVVCATANKSPIAKLTGLPISLPSIVIAVVGLLAALIRIKRPFLRRAWVNFAFSVIGTSFLVTLAIALAPVPELVPVAVTVLAALRMLMARNTAGALASVGVTIGAALTLVNFQAAAAGGSVLGVACDAERMMGILAIMSVLGAGRVFLMVTQPRNQGG
jgi:subtilisin family serine protease